MKKFLIPIGVLWVVVAFVIGVMIMLLPSTGSVNRVRQVTVNPRPKISIVQEGPAIDPIETGAMAKVTIIDTKSSSVDESKVSITKKK